MKRRPKPKKRWGYSVPELAEMVGVHRSTMWRRLKREGLIRPGRDTIPLSEIRAALAEWWISVRMQNDIEDLED